MGKKLTITISFKEDEFDLYDYTKRKKYYSAYVKNLIEEDKKKEIEKKENTITRKPRLNF